MNSASFLLAQLPVFSAIDPATIEPLVRAQLQKNQQAIEELLSSNTVYTWDNLIKPLEEMADELNKFWSPIAHLHSVMGSEELRRAYHRILPLMTEYQTLLSQNEKLYQAILSIKESKTFDALTKAQQKMIDNDIRDFRLSGVHLPSDKKSRLVFLQKELSELMTNFSENALDATQTYALSVEYIEDLAGLPPQAIQLAKTEAEKRNLAGYALTLDYPAYSTAMKFLKNRQLRQTLYEAHSTRASDCGPNAHQFENTHLMDDILKIRHEIAELVGYQNYALYSLATKMAKTPEEVLHFLRDLLARSKPFAKKEFAELSEFAKQMDGLSDLKMWDVAYYSEKWRERNFYFTQEDLRPYFPIDHVLNGLFQLLHTLYGLTLKEEPDVNVWHPDVRFLTVYDEEGQLRGGLYLDLYARPQKREGAWMDECRARRWLQNGTLQYPVAYLTCNFMPPGEAQPALLTHDDVLTLFHELGHCLHHVLTKVDEPGVGGINGVPWDAVEFPSQFMENFCWEKVSLDLIAAHYQTGETLPPKLYQHLHASKNFQIGLQFVRQLEFSLYDFCLHLDFDPQKKDQVQSMLTSIREETTVIPVPEFNRFPNTFSHVFAGGYAAGYYSYKWAEVLSADAYDLFEEKGILNPAIGRSFMKQILEVGGVRDPMDSFVAFRERELSIDSLLKQNGIG